MKRTAAFILAVLLLAAAAGLTAYPLISNWVNDRYQSLVLTRYEEEIDAAGKDDLVRARDAAQAYNDSLSPLRYSPEGIRAASEDYESLLDPDGSGIMGSVEIPKLEITLPIYHGTHEDVLGKGAGHLPGSSLPVGGNGCHSVLTGHSGVAGKRLFSDIDQMGEGDVFFLRVLGEALAYEVDKVSIVEPHETGLLAPVRGRDLCTLVTCYPYGVNTHRLLVRGSRIPYDEAAGIEKSREEAPVRSTWREQYFKGLAAGGAGALGLLFAVLLIRVLRRKRRRK